jgi:magnesium transporter
MSLVAHKTNQIMSKLTVVSIIFLPLTFLCGVYGMNFEVIPELKWKYGYIYFWSSVGLLVLGLVWLMRRNKLL